MRKNGFGKKRVGKFRPGLYRMRVVECGVWQRGFDPVKVVVVLESTELRYATKRLVIEVDWADDTERQNAMRVFELAGVRMDCPRDINHDYVGIRGREFYVEVMRDGFVHVQQLANTDRLTSPMKAGAGRVAEAGMRATIQR